MKQIQAIIRPEKLDAVKIALVGLGINGMTVTSVQGFGKQLGHAEVYRGVKVEAKLLPKVMITTVVTDAAMSGVIEAIKATAQTGEVGDGKIIVMPVEASIRIRTGETGDSTLDLPWLSGQQKSSRLPELGREPELPDLTQPTAAAARSK